MPQYIVINEHTLAYTQNGTDLVGVLHGKVTLGGYDWKNGPVAIRPGDRVREATVADFEFFRVSPRGHLA